MASTEPRVINGQEVKIKAGKWTEALFFVPAIWLLSRLVVIIAMQLIAPMLPLTPVAHSGILPLGFTPGFVPKSSWILFSHWDGAWYRQITTVGYDFINNGEYHTVAFFPLFPIIVRVVMLFGLPFEIAATLVNNLALFGAMWIVYHWMQERYDITTARWSTAVLAWCPLSLFGTVIYTEGLFLLFSTAALRAFDKSQYTSAGLWGAMATATRSTGLMLVPSFLIVAWRENRPKQAYFAAFATTIGLILFSLYCGWRFGDLIAFVNVQKAWNWQHPGWWNVLIKALTLDKENLLRIVMFFGGGYLLWHYRTRLPLVTVVYGFTSLIMIQATGSLSSVSRYVYGIISVSLALGILLANHPRWGYLTLSLFATVLAYLSIKFAWWYWVA
ncbi:MAG: mannosyltransferase family protein [Coleofasciculaceae cyanobacterium]